MRDIFNVPTLKSRRELFCVLFFYKVLNNEIDCVDILNSVQFAVPCRFLRNHRLFANVFTRSNAIANFYLYKFYKLYNKFSNDLDIFNMSFKVFKSTCVQIFK